MQVLRAIQCLGDENTTFGQVEIEPVESHPATWQWQDVPTKGEEFVYRVIDQNFRNYNRWEFLVRVPSSAGGVIVVPSKTPNKKVFAGLERRSIVLARCTVSGFAGQLYSKIFLSDPTQEKNRRGVRIQQRRLLPPWFSYFRNRLHRKSDVAKIQGTDWDSLVCTFSEDDHNRMIRLYFAMRVWILQESFVLETT